MCECYVTVSKNDPRYEIWAKVDPKARLPLKHPGYVKHPMFPGLFLEGDVSRLSKEQQKIIVEEMSRKFKVSKAHVKEGLSKGVLLIKSENTRTVICNLHLRCMM